ncbi:MAG: zinc-binding dehydrogenase [Steroidobacteraceae bacterium]|nr:zinc-binding dehydrogenase [Steroidobacteraceae bacterium]
MHTDPNGESLQLRSLVKASGELELSLVPVAIPQPGPDEVLIRVEAAPLNPSDLGLLFGAADMTTAHGSGSDARPVVTARIPDGLMNSMAARVDVSMPVGNEGAGVVIATGASDEAKALLGKTVAAFGGAMYSQHRCVKAAQCLELPAGTTLAEGASCFVNPLTALGMIETMRNEGHTALGHTAAASNLGQMLNRLCLADGIGLVSVVRSTEQAELLRAQGAKHVCVSAAESFSRDLADAIAATGATLGFDAVGGGRLAGQLLAAMEAALMRSGGEYQRYGSTTHKQVYIYGSLDNGPTELRRNFGAAWGLGGWLLPIFLQKVGPEVAQRLRARVVAGLGTIFASRYTKVVSMAEALSLEEIATYGRRSTGAKYLVNPNK